MNSITRFLAITGIGLAAGVSIGAGPAQAAAGAGNDGTHRAAAQNTAHWNDDDDIMGYFNSPFRCEQVGRIGELRDRWDDHECNPVLFGFHRGYWALEVSYGEDWGGHGFRVDCPPAHVAPVHVAPVHSQGNPGHAQGNAGHSQGHPGHAQGSGSDSGYGHRK